ncbi:endocuticle structural glycoprotein SgAbd-2-like isoform X2 [Uranotaenia lowii]|nr:endocuticle structural glycoprotein SgAbd-2-like isoform X2 [Uranotaenia lowii]
MLILCAVAKPQNQFGARNVNQNVPFSRNLQAPSSQSHHQQQQFGQDQNQVQQYQQHHQQHHQQNQHQQQQQHHHQHHQQRFGQPFQRSQALRVPPISTIVPPPQPFQQQQSQYSQQYNQQQGYLNPSRPFVPITSYNNDVSYDGSYAYSYTTGDGQQQQAQGYLKNPGLKDLEAQAVQGSYSYTSPEGQQITVTYIADENGFRAEGAHLPTPPPIPEAIQKSLALIAATQPVSQKFSQAYSQQPFGTQQNSYNRYG